MENGKKVIIKMKKTGSSSMNSQDDSNLEPKTAADKTSKFDNDSESKRQFEDFGKMLDESMSEMDLNPGDLVSGTVVEVRDDLVFVDISFKSEGKINRHEFDDKVNVGDKVNVVIVTTEDEEGDIVLSKKQADEILANETIKNMFENGGGIDGKVLRDVKGGFVVDIGLEAFLPISQLEMYKKVAEEEKNTYIGKRFTFKVIKYEPQNKNIVVSRRSYLEEEKEKQRTHFFENIKEGDTVKGSVKNIMDYGVFIDLGGIDGFVPLKDLAWGHTRDCHDVVKVGQELKAKVVKIDHTEHKVTLSLKELTEDPWINFGKKHKKEDVINGEVTKLMDFGVFVKLIDGVEGLLPISEISWTKKIAHPKEVLKRGNEVKVKIIEIDAENRKVTLSLRQILPNPWDTVDEVYPIGSKITGKIARIADFGAFIEIDKNITGLLHQNDMDWLNKGVDPKKMLKRGDSIELIVLDINKSERNISLGLKQLLDNPVVQYASEHPKGSIIRGKITKILDFGMFVKLTEHLEGLIHISNIDKKKVENLNSIYKVGDEVDAVITDVDSQRCKISLSIKDYEKRIEQINIEKYVSQDENEGSSLTLGDFIDKSKFDKK